MQVGVIFRAIARLRDGATPAQAAAEATSRARMPPGHGPGGAGAVRRGGTDRCLRGARAASDHGRRSSGHPRAARGGRPAAGHGDRQRRQPATRARDDAPARDGGARGHRRRPAPHRQATADRERDRRPVRRRRRAGARRGVCNGCCRRCCRRGSRVSTPWRSIVRVLSFALAVSVVASVACGLLPAWHTRRVNLVETLSEDGVAPIGGAMRSPMARTRGLIMVGQVAIACVLLVGAALLTRSFVSLIARRSRLRSGERAHRATAASARAIRRSGAVSCSRRWSSVCARCQA